MRTHGWWVAFVLASALPPLVGCRENPAIDPNATPTAVAWVAGADHPIPRDSDCEEQRKAEQSDQECPIDEVARRMGVEVPYDGSPVTVTLDATHSSDRDGEVVKYRWLSANFGPDCAGRDDDPDHDPAEQAKPKLTLDEGFWEFGLWVEDDAGATSSQSVVTVRVGPGSTDPCPNGPGGGEGGEGGDGEDAGAADAGGAAAEAQLMCVMGCASTECPAEATACDGNAMCWPLVDCVATMCADVDPMDMTAITSCAVANCAASLTGATEATAVATCAVSCRDGACAM